MKKILFITPHLSTGGAPQFTLNKISLLKDNFEIKCVEHTFMAWNLVVQRNKIIEILGDNFYSLGNNKSEELMGIINDFKPDYISMEEFPEFFLDDELTKKIYDENRNYRIFETTHDSSFPVDSKRWFPDKFIFVSAFNAVRYSMYDIPYDVIEYPIEIKEKKHLENRNILGFDSSWKHVVNIGLFTPRKNQKYIFEIAEKLKDYKIKFHFVGNQADNFKFYWEPLMNSKPENCVVWGERNDVSSFLQASDLFLFTSKGDKNNKELNPIAIKESIEYDMPMAMFNLDVYCGKYNNNKNINFLSGDLDSDTDKILNILGINKEKLKSELIVIGTYPNTKTRKKLTKECIESVLSLNRKIMLVSHYPVSEEIQKMVDFYVYDKHNPLVPHSYYTKFYNYTNRFDVEIKIDGLKNTNQSLTVLTNLFNSVKSAKNFGYDKIVYLTYDVIVSDKDIPTIDDMFNRLDTRDGYFATLPTPFGHGIETTAMSFKVDYFLNTFEDVRDGISYNNLCNNIGSQNFLEDYFSKKIFPSNNVDIITNEESTLLINSGKGTSSNSEYYSLVPVKGSSTDWCFYFYTYNIDDRKITIKIKDNNNYITNVTFKISEQKEFYKIFSYRNTPISIDITFYDGEEILKTENYILNEKTKDRYQNNGIFKDKTPPKIKLIHLQTTTNNEKEIKSRESLEPLSKFGINYVLHQNDLYKSLPPSHNCLRPQSVSMELFDDEQIKEKGTALTPAHYGCFESFKNGILSEFSDDLDFLIVCEGDCILEVSHEEFVSKLYQICEIVKENSIDYFSFGDVDTLDFGWKQSNVISEIPNQDLMFITDKIIGLQCIMFPKKIKNFLFNNLINHKWDASDIYFNIIFSNKTKAILYNRMTSQCDGISFIDNQNKVFRKP
jgi:hypothetical protein